MATLYAFPHTKSDTVYSDQRGMSLREHYAGLAMQALVSRQATGDAAAYLNAAGVVVDHKELAREAFRIADAMIAF